MSKHRLKVVDGKTKTGGFGNSTQIAGDAELLKLGEQLKTALAELGEAQLPKPPESSDGAQAKTSSVEIVDEIDRLAHFADGIYYAVAGEHAVWAGGGDSSPVRTLLETHIQDLRALSAKVARENGVNAD
jgi:hypothetical protein